MTHEEVYELFNMPKAMNNQQVKFDVVGLQCQRMDCTALYIKFLGRSYMRVVGTCSVGACDSGWER